MWEPVVRKEKRIGGIQGNDNNVDNHGVVTPDTIGNGRLRCEPDGASQRWHHISRQGDMAWLIGNWRNFRLMRHNQHD